MQTSYRYNMQEVNKVKFIQSNRKLKLLQITFLVYLNFNKQAYKFITFLWLPMLRHAEGLKPYTSIN